jgi:hypothetical protein
LANDKRTAVRGMTVTMERVEESSGQLELWEMEGGTAERRNGGTGSSPPASMPGEKLPRYARDDIGATSTVPPFRRSAVEFRRSAPLQRALDTIRSRYGARGVARGSQLAALTTRDAP